MSPRFSLLAISDRRTLQSTAWDLTDWLRALGAAGIGGVQIREKDLEDGDLSRLDGAHLPAGGLPAAPLRDRFGPGVLLGRSTHCLEEVEQARDEGVDYAVFGPVYDTPGKGEPLGLEALARAVAVAGKALAVFALGGVTLPRFGELAAVGAAGVAAIRLFQHPADLGPVAHAAREHFGRA